MWDAECGTRNVEWGRRGNEAAGRERLLFVLAAVSEP